MSLMMRDYRIYKINFKYEVYVIHKDFEGEITSKGWELNEETFQIVARSKNKALTWLYDKHDIESLFRNIDVISVEESRIDSCLLELNH